MFYVCTLKVLLNVCRGARVDFSPVVEVSLACHRCRRTDRTIILRDSLQAEHWGMTADHSFLGRVAALHTDTAPVDDDSILIVAHFRLEYEFEQFEDAKDSTSVVSPHPRWARIRFTLICPCGKTREAFTQTNLTRPRDVRCECGKILLVEQDQVILFSKASPLDSRHSDGGT